MYKILILGSDGQLANDLFKVIPKGKFLISKLNHKDLDITHFKKTNEVITKIKPRVIINTVAYHNTKLCEENPSLAFEVNSLSAFNIAKIAKKIYSRLVFFSSDYVFDGKKKYYFENDIPSPLNVYGASKLSGEALIKIATDDYLIIRTTALYGEKNSGKGHNFVKLMLDKAKTRKSIKVVDDQYISPTYTFDLAKKIIELIEKKVPSGTYHLVNSGSCSWYEFANYIFKYGGVKVDLDKTKTQAKDDIKRPKYSILKTSKLQQFNIKPLRHWKKSLFEFIENYKT